MKISVFGLGYVGSVTAACFAEKGHDVIGVEVNADKLGMFQRGQSPLFEPGLAELLTKVHAAGKFTATGSAAEAVRGSEISFICVGTPSKKGGQADLSHVENVCREIGEAVKVKNSPHTVVAATQISQSPSA